MKYIIHTDGGARGNPGPAAVGVVIEREETPGHKSETVVEFGRRIGETTNNVAEYTAVIEALKEFTVNSKFKNTDPTIRFLMDSTLVANQLNGLFKVKDAKLRDLLTHIRILETEIRGNITYSYIPREQNRRADYWVNRALDNDITA
jgi:ribonuclease HI